MVLFSIIHTLLIIHTLYIIRIIKWTIMYYSVFITKEVATITKEVATITREVATITREVDIGQAQVFSSPSLTPAYASHKLSFASFF